MATSLTFGNHLKFGQDSCHTSKGRPTFLPRERKHSKLRANNRIIIEKGLQRALRAWERRHGRWSNEGPSGSPSWGWALTSTPQRWWGEDGVTFLPRTTGQGEDGLRLFRPILPRPVLINVIIVNFSYPKTLLSLCLYFVICYTMRFLFLLWYCLVKYLDNIIQLLLKIILIWWDKFSCNFKYIFINEIGFIDYPPRRALLNVIIINFSYPKSLLFKQTYQN